MTIRDKQHGAGFIEVIVSLVVLAIGLLGVLSLQARGLTSNQRALFATEANILAADMVDRIVAADADNGEYDDNANADADAIADRGAWVVEINASILPLAIGNVTWNGNDNEYTISIRWDQNRQGLAAGAVEDDCADNNPQNTFTCLQLQVTL